MHKIADKEFTLDDFSCEHLLQSSPTQLELYSALACAPTCDEKPQWTPMMHLLSTIVGLNHYREKYLETKDKKYWWQIIQLLPSSYNQRRTVMLNYEVLANIYKSRKNHKLDEWRIFCDWIKELPYSEIITGKSEMSGKEEENEQTNRKNIVDIVYSQISNVIELRTYGDDGLNQPLCAGDISKVLERLPADAKVIFVDDVVGVINIRGGEKECFLQK